MSLEADSIIQRMTADLRSGDFAPGSWLKQIDLQRRYGAGRAPIRKALEALAGRRLIVYEKNRGYSVYPADNAETRKVLEIRVAIETGFTEAICRMASEGDIAELARLADAFAETLSDGSYYRLYGVNLAFHRKLLQCAGNDMMVGMIDDLRLRTSPAPISQWLDRSRVERSAEDHKRMVAAVRERDAALLASLIRLHIMQ